MNSMMLIATWCKRISISCVWLLVFFTPVTQAKNAEQRRHYEQAVEQYRQGAFDRAVTLWRQIALEVKPRDSRMHLRAQLGIASACQKMGLYQEAAKALSIAQPLLKKSDEPNLTAQYYQQLGNLNLAEHRHEQSLRAFVEGINTVKHSGDIELHALLLNDYGNALNVSGYESDAIAAHRASLVIAREHNLMALALNASINIARLHVRREDNISAIEALQDAKTLLDSLSPSYEWAMTLLALNDLENMLSAKNTTPSEMLDADERIGRLRRVRDYAVETHNARLRSLSYGYEAQDHLLLGDVEKAEVLVRQAIFYAAEDGAHDILYRWYWQLARMLRQQGELTAAIEMFDRSLTTLAPIRQELLSGYHDSHAFFQQHIRAVYIDFAAALLHRADTVDDNAAQRASLDKTRNVLELLKSAELQDYFRDECVVAQESKAMNLEQVASTTAILYPIVMADRVELLLSINGELSKQSVVVTQSQLLEDAQRLRELIQDASNERYLPYANRLYRWLIDPIKQQLLAAGIDTLVIIPDSVLRTIPFAALHSNERFLVEEFALAVTPSLKLTAASGPTAARATALLAGVAPSVQGFSPLPKVTAELTSIHEHFDGLVLKNDKYTKAKLISALEASEYNILHMATHSVVSASPEDSFLLTYDGRLTMGDLEYLLRIGKFREQPLELLTLSACETAISDERAALGMAGVAVKSGAKSVLASLWLVEDSSTATLMSSFYRVLRTKSDSRISKARALRAAQMNLLADPVTQHPANWAAFMLIGNWL